MGGGGGGVHLWAWAQGQKVMYSGQKVTYSRPKSDARRAEKVWGGGGGEWGQWGQWGFNYMCHVNVEKWHKM